MAYGWARYVSVDERRRKAAAEMAKLAKKGQTISPVVIQGRAIADTAWGKAWCANMESYSDFSNRLPRGRTYVRNGSVVDLQIAPGTVVARVSGSSMYRTTITVQPVLQAKWQQVCADCAGGIDSLVELLQGRFSKGVMDRLCRQGDGLFPMPKDIAFDCSCPDGASMCKHVAAVLYGIGARFDSQPELLFRLRQVDPADLLSKASSGVVNAPAGGGRTLADDDVGALFGLEMDASFAQAPAAAAALKKPRVPAKPAGVSPPGTKPSGPGTKPARARDPAVRLLAALRQAGALDNAAARAATGLDAEAVRPLLRQLVADGHAHVQGRGRGTRYVAVRSVLKA
ncbi:MAG: SWIM zinc finger family protein [Aquabacterium sp.]|nr:SWIM zinc finger family protein [Aquabacterium sp.]